jgi:O-acetyl-ADP-ribose deacetylase (regulator of RNase III)
MSDAELLRKFIDDEAPNKIILQYMASVVIDIHGNQKREQIWRNATDDRIDLLESGEKKELSELKSNDNKTVAMIAGGASILTVTLPSLAKWIYGLLVGGL